MTHFQATTDTDKLKALSASGEGMAALAGQILSRVLEAQLTEHLRAEHL